MEKIKVYETDQEVKDLTKSFIDQKRSGTAFGGAANLTSRLSSKSINDEYKRNREKLITDSGKHNVTAIVMEGEVYVAFYSPEKDAPCVIGIFDKNISNQIKNYTGI